MQHFTGIFVCMNRNFAASATVLALLGGLLGAVPASADAHEAAQALLEAGVPQGVLTELTTSERTAMADSLDSSAAASEVSMVTLVAGQPKFETVEIAPRAAQDVAEVLADQPSIEAAGVAQPMQILIDPYRTNQWPLNALQVESSRALLPSGTRPVVAVLDTGVLGTHPDLQAALLPGKDFIASGDGRIDPHGHGTHVAGTIGATVGNGVGVEGFLANVSILPVRVMNATGAGNTSLTAQGITWATDNGADVINLSLGGTGSDPTLEYAVNYATSLGVSVVAAMGNAGNAVPLYPATYANVIAVGATTETDERASYSSTGGHIDVSAPGSSVLSTIIGNTEIPYGYKSGTSMATPHVAAVVAGLGALYPTLTPSQLQTHLQDTSKDLGVIGFDTLFGHGRIDAYTAFTTNPAGAVGSVPSAPQGVTYTPGNASATITWSAPSSSGSSALSGYTVSLAAPGLPVATASVSATTTTASLNGLTNGVAYSVRVTARNGQGFSTSESGHSVRPRTVPNAPTILSAAGSDGAVDLRWNAPSFDGGSSITGYTVSISATGVPAATRSFAATDTSARLTGLSNGVSYSLRVSATNLAGTSDSSGAMSGMPRTVTSAPSLTKVTLGNAALGIYWNAPAYNGGSAITGYTVTVLRTGQATKTFNVAATARSLGVSGLANGASYSVRVQAKNNAGTSAVSNTVAAIPRTVPTAPQAPKTASGSTHDRTYSVKTSWTAPASYGGNTISTYTVRLRQVGSSKDIVKTTAGTVRSVAFTGLSKGAKYTLTVQAHNAAGASPNSVRSSAAVAH